MFAAYTELQNAQAVKEFLVKKQVVHPDFLPLKELGYIYFPITKKMAVPKAKVVQTKITFPPREKPRTVDDLLKNKLSKEELELLPRSQEIVGHILILEIPEELTSKEKLIAEAYLNINRQIDTVVRKEGIHSGEFRTRTVRILAGKKSKETVHKESGVDIKLHLEKTYFSARSGNERLRITKMIKPGEDVLVMFSGAAPYPLVFARNSDARQIYGIELNPLAHAYAHENIHLNRLEHKITLHNGNVLTILPKLKRKFDRIAMPLPKTGEDFLPIALSKVKPKGIIHLYSFLDEKDIQLYAQKIKDIARRSNHPVRVLRSVQCGQFSPGTFRVCFDLKVLE
ncbi:class I SAM-dependent methyltransferase family protein [Candidatus Woesearchaeota archaeon]|nr:class I SAM-dependent methyltransferase family protein [Candidatus Woesearchaeota archaeon]